MQDLIARDKANQEDPIVGETVYVNAYGCRGEVKRIEHKGGNTTYLIEVHNEEKTKTRRLRREIVRVVQ